MKTLLTTLALASVAFAVDPTSQPASQPTSQPGGIVYKGKDRSAAWLESQYQKFADKIVAVDGKFIDIGKERCTETALSPLKGARLYNIELSVEVGQTVPTTGAVIEKILDAHSIAGKRELPKGGDCFFTVTEIDAAKLTPGQPLPWKSLVCVAYVEYGGHPVCRYRVPVKLTREEFRAAVESGFVLTAYRTVPVKSGTPGGIGFGSHRMKIVATEVP